MRTSPTPLSSPATAACRRSFEASTTHVAATSNEAAKVPKLPSFATSKHLPSTHCCHLPRCAGKSRGGEPLSLAIFTSNSPTLLLKHHLDSAVHTSLGEYPNCQPSLSTPVLQLPRIGVVSRWAPISPPTRSRRSRTSSRKAQPLSNPPNSQVRSLHHHLSPTPTNTLQPPPPIRQKPGTTSPTDAPSPHTSPASSTGPSFS